jgi:hypothetical protein
MEAYTQLWATSEGWLQLVRDGAKAALDVERRAACTKGSVFESHGRTEHGHEAVTGKILEDTSVTLDDVSLLASQPLDQREYGLLAQTLRQ